MFDSSRPRAAKTPRDVPASGLVPQGDDDRFPAWTLRLHASDQGAFAELFEAWHGILLRYAWRLVRSEEEAQDVVQEAFLKLWQVRASLDPKRSLKALLFTMVRNLSLNRNRHGRYVAATPVGEDLQDGGPAEDVRLEALLLERHLRETIDRLPARRREAFLLSRMEGLSHDEIAHVMAVSPRTVNAHIVLALKELRKALRLLKVDRGASPSPA